MNNQTILSNDQLSLNASELSETNSLSKLRNQYIQHLAQIGAGGNSYAGALTDGNGLKVDENAIGGFSFKTANDISPQKYTEYLANQRHSDPNYMRTIAMKERESRAKRILDGNRQAQEQGNEYLRSLGYDQTSIDDINKYTQAINSVPMVDRIKNFLAKQEGSSQTFEDPYVANIINNEDISVIAGMYGKESADLISQIRSQNGADIANLIKPAHLQNNISEDITDIGLSVLSKGARTLESLNPVKLVDPSVKTNQVSEWLNEQRSLSRDLAEERSLARDNLNQAQIKQDTQQNIDKGLDANLARQLAEDGGIYRTVTDLFEEPEKLTSDALEITADVAIGTGVYGSAAKLGAKTIGKIAEKSATKTAIEASKKAKATASAAQSKASNSELLKQAYNTTKANNPHLTGSALRAQAKATHQNNLQSPLIQQQIKAFSRNAGNKAALAQSSTIKAARDKAIKEAEEFGAKAFGLAGAATHSANVEAQNVISHTYDTLVGMSDDYIYATTRGKKEIDNLLSKYGYDNLDLAKNDKKFRDDLYTLKSDLASEASRKAFSSVFAQSFGVNLFTSGLEAKLAGAGGKISGLKNKVKDTALNTLKEMLEEYVESGAGAVEDKKAINATLESPIYNDTDLMYQRNREGIKGSIIAALGTSGLSGIGSIRSGAKSAKNVATQTIYNRTNSQNIANAQQTQQQANQIFGITPQSNNNNNQSNQNTQSNSDTTGTNQATNTQSIWQQIAPAMQQVFVNETNGRDINNFAEIISLASHSAHKAQEQIDKLQAAGKEIPQDLKTKVDTYEAVRHNMAQAAFADILQRSQELQIAHNELIQAHQSKDQTKINEATAKFQQLEKTNKRLADFNKSSYGKLLATSLKESGQQSKADLTQSAVNVATDPFPTVLAQVNKQLDDISQGTVVTPNQPVQQPNSNTQPQPNTSGSNGSATVQQRRPLTPEEINVEFGKATQLILSSEKGTNEEKINAIKDVMDRYVQMNPDISDSHPSKVILSLLNEQATKDSNQVVIDSLIGSYNPVLNHRMKGLLEYHADFMANGNKLSFDNLSSFSNWQKSQMEKERQYIDMIDKMKQDPQYKNPNSKLSKYYNYSNKANKNPDVGINQKGSKTRKGFNTVTQAEQAFALVRQTSALMNQMQVLMANESFNNGQSTNKPNNSGSNKQPQNNQTNQPIKERSKISTNVNQELKDDSNVVVYGDSLDVINKISKTNPTQDRDTRIRGSKNSFGFPVGNSIDSSGYVIHWTDSSLETNKQFINRFIDELKYKRDKAGKTIIFSNNGIGLGLADTAPETFKYLNRRLDEEFDYINANPNLRYIGSQKLLDTQTVLKQIVSAYKSDRKSGRVKVVSYNKKNPQQSTTAYNQFKQDSKSKGINSEIIRPLNKTKEPAGSTKAESYANPYAKDNNYASLYLEGILTSREPKFVWIREQIRQGKLNNTNIFQSTVRNPNQLSEADILYYLVNTNDYEIREGLLAVKNIEDRDRFKAWVATKETRKTKLGEIDIAIKSNDKWESYLSNLTPSPFEINGITFESIEQAYQALKQYRKDLWKSFLDGNDSIPTTDILSYVNNSKDKASKGIKVSSGTATFTQNNENYELMKALMMKRAEADSGYRSFLAGVARHNADPRNTKFKFKHSIGDAFWKKAFPQALHEVSNEIIKVKPKFLDSANKDNLEIISGGAYGVDRMAYATFRDAGFFNQTQVIHEGQKNENEIFKPSATNVLGTKFDVLPQSEESYYENLAKEANINLPTDKNKERIKQLGLRSIRQVEKANTIIAMAPIKEDGSIEGGTNIAVAYAKHTGKSLYVFDFTKNQWNQWDSSINKFVLMDTFSNFVVGEKVAIIGSRAVEDYTGSKPKYSVLEQSLYEDRVQDQLNILRDNLLDNTVQYSVPTIVLPNRNNKIQEDVNNQSFEELQENNYEAIRDRIIQAFAYTTEREIDRFVDGYVVGETKFTFTLPVGQNPPSNNKYVEVVDDEVTVSIPNKYLVQKFNQGLDLTNNSFKDYAKWENTLAGFSEDTRNGITVNPLNLQEITYASRKLVNNYIEDSFYDNLDSNSANFAKAYVMLYNKVEAFLTSTEFGKNSLKIFKLPTHNENESGFINTNALYNFMALSEPDANGTVNPIVKYELVKAMTDAIARTTGLVDKYSKIFDEKSFLEFLIPFGNVRFERNGKDIQQGSINFELLGVESKTFVREMGQALQNSLGLSFKDNVPNTYRDNIQHSLGLSIVGFMKANKMLSETSIIPEGTDTATVTYYRLYSNFANNKPLEEIVEFNSNELMVSYLEKGFNSPFYKMMFQDKAPDLGLEITNLKDISSLDEVNYRRASVKDNKDPTYTNSGYNQEILERLDRANKVTFTINPYIKEQIQNNEDTFKRLNGWREIPQDASESLKSQIEAKNRRIENDIELLNQLYDLLGNMNPKDAIITFKHKFADNGRIIPDSLISPTSSKIIREAVVPRDFLETEGNPLVALDLKASKNPLKPKYFKDSDTFLDDLLAKTKSRSKPLRGASIGLSLALAQSMGIKVEKLSTENILESLQQKWKEDNIPHILKSMEEGTKLEELMEYFGTGTDAHRLYSNLLQVNKLINSKDSSIPLYVYLEADGIANGFFNIIMQFSTKPTSEFIDTLKRTGNITLDILASKGKKEVKQLEGSSEVFEQGIKDIYQELAFKASIDLRIKLNDLIQEFSKNPKIKNLSWIDTNVPNTNSYIPQIVHAYLVATQGKNYRLPKSEVVKYYSDLLKPLSVLMQIYQAEGFDWKGIKANSKDKIDRDRFIKGLEKLFTASSSKELVGTLNHISKSLELNRAIGKIVTTPSMYGAGIVGITNQAISEIYSNLKDKILNKELTELDKQFLKMHGIKFDSKLDYTKNENVDLLIRTLQSSFGDLSYSIGNGLGEILYDTIQTRFHEQFANINYTTSFGEANFNQFVQEFLKQYKATKHAELKANNELGTFKEYIPLSMNQVKKIIQNIYNNPNVGTAYSGNTQLVQSLYDLGVSLLKQGETNLTEQNDIGNSTGVTSNIPTKLLNPKVKGFSVETAGASQNTSTVPTTESMSLSLTQQRLLLDEVKRHFLNVYDGLDGLYLNADVISELINKNTWEVHTENSLLENFFHLFNKSEMSKDLSALENIFPDVDKTLSLKELRALNVTLSLAQMYFNDLKSKEGNTKEIKDNLNVLGSLRKTISNVLLASELEEAKGLFEPRYSISSMLMGDSKHLSNTKKQQLQKLNNMNKSIGMNQLQLFNTMLNNFAKRVSNSYATKQLLKELPIQVSQFGGSADGYRHNFDLLTGKNNVSTRFQKFTQKYPNLSGSNALEVFIKQDPELSHKYNNAFNEKMNQLKVIYMSSNNNPYAFHLQVENTSNMEELFEVMDKEISKNFGNHSNTQTTFKVLKEVLPNLISPNEKIYTNDLEFMETYIQKFNPSFEREESVRESILNSRGLYIKGVGVLVNKHASTTYDVMTLMHELMHAANDNLLNNYFFNYHNMNPSQRQAVTTLINNAKAFAFKQLNDPKMAEAIDELRDIAINGNLNSEVFQESFYKSLSSNIPTAQSLAAYVKFAFTEIRNLQKQGRMSENQMKQIQKLALDEFLAWSLTESDILKRMQYTKGANKGAFESFDRKVSKEMKQTLKASYESLETQLMKSYGGRNDFFTDENRSILFNILGAYSIASKYQTGTTVSSPSEISVLSQVNRDDLTGGIPYSTLISSSITLNPDFGNELSDFVNAVQRNFELTEPSVSNSVNLQTLLDNQYNNEVTDYMINLRRNGLPITLAEESAIKLAYGTYRVLQDNNPNFSQELNKFIKEFLDNFNPNTSSLSQLAQRAIFNPPKRSDYNAMLGALILGSYYINQEIKGMNGVNKPFGQTKKFVDKFLNNNYQLNSSSSLEHLKSLATGLTFESKNQFNQLAQNRQRLFDRENRLLSLSDTIQKATEGFVGKDMSQILSAPVAVIATGQALNIHEMDSSLTEVVMDWLDTRDTQLGYKSYISTILRWFVGARSKTFHWYKMKNQSKAHNDQIREQITTMVPQGLRENFKNGLSKREEQAIDNVLLPTMLNRVFYTGLNNTQVSNMFRDSTYRESYLNNEYTNLETELQQSIKNPKTLNEVMNFIRWQTQGLAELMVTKQAKGNAKEQSHYILPNTRMIAKVLSDRFGVNLNQVSKNYINSITSIGSLDYVSKEDLSVMADLLEKDPNAFHELLESINLVNHRSERKYTGSMLGEDGFRMNHKNPLEDVRIISPNDTDGINLLHKQGYQQKSVLPTGELVFHNSMVNRKRFTNGILSLAEHSVYGTNITSGLSIGSFAEKTEYKFAEINNGFNRQLSKAIKDPDFYNNQEFTSSRRLLVTTDGSFRDIATDLPRDLENQLIKSTENGIDAIGNYYGRISEEDLNEDFNRQAIDTLLNKAKTSGANRKYFISFDGKIKPKDSTERARRQAQELNEIYNSLPYATKQYIESKGGLEIDIRELENIVGYNQASLVDIYEGKSGLPKDVQKVIKGVFDAFAGVTGFSPIKSIAYLEKGLSEITSLSKDVILNRSGIVAAGNLIGNIIHLWTAGVPLTSIVPEMVKALSQAKEYQRLSNEKQKLSFMVQSNQLNQTEKNRIQAQIKSIEDSLNRSSIKELGDNGIFNSVQAMEITDSQKEEFTLLKSLKDKAGLNLNKFEDNSLMKGINNLLVREGSTTHNFMTQVLDYGDFTAKKVLYESLIKRGYPKDVAIEIIRDEFVNYTMNRGREFDYMNRLGLTWFLSYKLAIQKAIFRNLRRNTLRTLATYAGMKTFKDTPLIDLMADNVVLKNNLIWDGSLNYQTSPSNIYKGFTSHWLDQVF